MKILKGCEYGIFKLVKQGIEEGGDPTISNNSPITLAADFNHVDIVKYLLSIPKVDPTHGHNMAIWNAVQEENYKIVKILLDDNRVLRKAVKDGDIDHFIEIVNKELKDPKWIESISKRIDKLKKKK